MSFIDIVLCFFFKQKTAYEMRISDWSSDVCSSDLTILTVLDALHMPHDPLLLLGIIAGGLLTKAALTLLALRLIGRAVADVVANMRLELIETVMNARWSFYIRQPVGRFSTALGGEAQKAGDAYNAMTQMFSQSVQAMFYLIIAAIASWQLAILSLLVSAVMKIGRAHV